MSAFSGDSAAAAEAGRPTTRRELRARKRAEAEVRNAQANARMRPCGHVHGVSVACNAPAVSR